MMTKTDTTKPSGLGWKLALGALALLAAAAVAAVTRTSDPDAAPAR